MRISYLTEDTICALSTPYGTSALAIVRVSGERAYDIVARIIDKPLPKNCAGKHFLRRVEFAEGLFVDGVIICFKAPNSYTGENVLEITLPGNMLLVESLLERLKSLGGRIAEPGEFSFRAYLNGKLDLSQAEAVNDTIRAGSEEILRLAVHQLCGELSARVQNWLDKLNRVLAHIEVVHDYPGGVADASIDEREALGDAGSEVEFVRSNLMPVIQELESAIDFYNRYSRLREGLKVVILGAPNVGKSTLFNRLLGFERAIVTEIPGTTRDYLVESVKVGGVKVLLVDTAGLREAKELVEMIGMEWAKKLMSEADALIILEEVAFLNSVSANPLPRLSELVNSAKKENLPFFLGITKADTIPPENLRMVQEVTHKINAHLISSYTGTGLNELQLFLKSLTEVKETGIRYLLTERQKKLTEVAANSLSQALSAVENEIPLDVISIDLYSAQRALSSILWLESRDMVLDEIFRNFCVGK